MFAGRLRPTPSMGIAVAALVVAVSGTAVAATSAANGDTLIKKHTLSGNRLRDHTITGRQVNLKHLGTVPKAQLATHLPHLKWHTLTLTNGWAAYGGSGNTYYQLPAYTKDAQGVVHLRGALSGSGQTSNQFATLPTGFRPSVKRQWVPVASSNAASDPQLVVLDVGSDGTLLIYNGPGANDAFVSLDGVTFFAGP